MAQHSISWRGAAQHGVVQPYDCQTSPIVEQAQLSTAPLCDKAEVATLNPTVNMTAQEACSHACTVTSPPAFVWALPVDISVTPC